MIQLRDYQDQALETEAAHRQATPDETRLAIVLPTGTGKAITLAERARRFIDSDWLGCETAWGADLPAVLSRVLILVHTDELVSQLEATVRLICATSEWPIEVGVVKAERDEIGSDIIVASVQTLANPVRRYRIGQVGLVIVDECHHAAAPTYLEILRHFGCYGQQAAAIGNADQLAELARHLGTLPPTPALGFTATLERGDGAGLGAVWQDVAFTRDISWAVRRGYLVQPIGYRLEIGIPGTDSDDEPRRLMGNGGQSDDTALMDALAPEAIVAKWQELAVARKTIAFMPLVRSARALASAFLEVGVRAEVIHGDMPTLQRRDVVSAFRRGEVQVLCNAMVLTEGFDDPDTSCVIVGRPTKSRSLFIQMAGRGLRPAPGIPVEDQDCVLITVADATTDLCSVADLSDRALDRKADGPLTAMEDQWDIGKDLEDAARHWTGKVDATKFDPIVAARSKVWARTKAGHWFLPISKDREYVFLMDGPDGNTDIYVLTRRGTGFSSARVARAEKAATAPDRELAFALAEDEAAERGGDVGALLADRTRAWRKQVPADKMLNYARRLGLGDEVDRIMSARAGGKAGKVSDLIRRVEASRSIDPMVIKIEERAGK